MTSECNEFEKAAECRNLFLSFSQGKEVRVCLASVMHMHKQMINRILMSHQ